MLVAIEKIRQGARLRSISAAKVEQLAESISRLGLQTPVTLAEKIEYPEGQETTAYLLIAGAHRVAACQSLGLVEIEAVVTDMDDAQRQLWEIDENLCRADLTELERGEHLLKRKELYEWWYPETKPGVAGAVAMHKKDATTNLVPAFVADTSAKTGSSETAIKRSIARAKKIDDKVRDRIRDNPEIADSGVELDALAALAPTEQKRAVALVEAGQAAGIRDAKKLMEPKQPKPNFKAAMALDEKWKDQFRKLMATANDDLRQWAREQLDGSVADNTSLRVVK